VTVKVGKEGDTKSFECHRLILSQSPHLTRLMDQAAQSAQNKTIITPTIDNFLQSERETVPSSSSSILGSEVSLILSPRSDDTVSIVITPIESLSIPNNESQTTNESKEMQSSSLVDDGDRITIVLDQLSPASWYVEFPIIVSFYSLQIRLFRAHMYICD
jgi:hypothetical protein